MAQHRDWETDLCFQFCAPWEKMKEEYFFVYFPRVISCAIAHPLHLLLTLRTTKLFTLAA